MNTVEQTVRALIAAAGIEPDEEEILAAVEGYPRLRESLDRLHRAPIDHEEEPQTVFSARH